MRTEFRSCLSLACSGLITSSTRTCSLIAPSQSKFRSLRQLLGPDLRGLILPAGSCDKRIFRRPAQ